MLDFDRVIGRNLLPLNHAVTSNNCAISKPYDSLVPYYKYH